MLFNKNEKTADLFWQEFEEQTGEKVLSRGLGKYVSGWDEFDEKKWNGIWGLLINTSGGFRFHHFPQTSWLTALGNFGSVKPPKEKTIFIPNEKIVSSQLIKETKWWKKILSNSAPHLVINYIEDASTETKTPENKSSAVSANEKRLVFEAEYKIL